MSITEIADVQEAVRSAASSGKSVRVSGCGTWLNAGAPVRPSRTLSLGAYSGVSEYVPGNLTISVRAGTTLREIRETTARENQWFPIEPFGSEESSIGAVIATASYGPLVHNFGGPRDLVLGIQAVLGSGEIVRVGGRVVKNVAGYDLTRLLTGSWGTLGVITEVTLRLFGKQPENVTVSIAPGAGDKLFAAIEKLRAAELYPWAMELLDGNIASDLGIGSAASILVQFGGNKAVVDAQMQTLQGLYPVTAVDTNVWERLRSMTSQWSFRISSLPTELPHLWEAAGDCVKKIGNGVRVATPDRGVVRVFFSDPVGGRDILESFGALQAPAHLVREALPRQMWSFAAGNGIGTSSLAQGIKRVFDPQNILNPGILPL